MKPGTLFEALADIAAEHEANADPSRLLVLPAITDELETRRDLLSEVAEFLGGILVDLTGRAYRDPVDAYDNPLLRGTVGEGLTFDRPGAGGRTETKVLFAGGRVDVRLTVRDRPITVPNETEQRLMAVGRCLFDRRLDGAELALLVYDESTFDDDTQRAVLNMLAGLGRRPGIRLGTARTLVPLMQSSGLDRDKHCRPNRGVRFSLGGDELVRRNPPEHMARELRALTTARDQPLVLFLGAGFSASSGMPVGNGVRNMAIRRICELAPGPDGRDDQQLGRELYRFGRRPGNERLLSDREKDLSEDEFARTVTLEQAARIEADVLQVPVPPVIEEMRRHHNELLADPGFALGTAVYELHRMIDAGRRMVLVEVNFDELVELDHEDALDVAVDDGEFEDMAAKLAAMRTGAPHPDGKVPLLKLHGTINRPETCVVTDDVTRSGITTAKADALKAIVAGLPSRARAPWVYVGASMRDIDLDAVFAAREFNEDGVSERWVSPWPEPSVRRFVNGKRRWWASTETLLDRTITENADAFMSALALAWP